MKHIIFGGDGFLGQELARKLLSKNMKVIVCDIKKSESEIYPAAEHIHLDITKKEDFDALKVSKDDIVYQFAAKLLVPILPRSQRKDYFWSVLYQGMANVLSFLDKTKCRKIVYTTTDMVYGHTLFNPRTEEHPRDPLGPYGNAKYESEKLCEEYRKKGFNITIIRPRLIIGKGRLGILKKLFKLMDNNLPIPTIGNGKNYYQFISVSDCAEACIRAGDKGCPNTDFNVGSLNPPIVNDLLRSLIKEAGSKSVLIPTPAKLVKQCLAFLDRIGKPLMDPEQYLIAEETCVLDVSKGKKELGWIPQDRDDEMLKLAYTDYRKNL